MIRAVHSTKEELWRSRLLRFQASGLSAKRFCQLEHVSVPSFYQWRKRLTVAAAKHDGPMFVPVRLTQAAAVEIHLPNGTRVCLPPGHAESLRVAIETAGRLNGGQDTEDDAC